MNITTPSTLNAGLDNWTVLYAAKPRPTKPTGPRGHGRSGLSPVHTHDNRRAKRARGRGKRR